MRIPLHTSILFVLIGPPTLMVAGAARADQVLIETTRGRPATYTTLPNGAVAVVVPGTQGEASATRIFGAPDAPEPVLVELTAPALVPAAAAVTTPAMRGLAPVPTAARAAIAAQQVRVEGALQMLLGRRAGGGPRAASGIRHRYQNLFNGFAVELTRSEQDEIKRHPDILGVHPDTRVEASLDTSVPLVGAPAFWSNYSLRGQGTTIAVIDTGVYYLHADLGGCLGAGCKVIGGRDFVDGDNDPIDDHGHGTHVAATAAGDGVLQGVAPDASILAYKALDTHGSGFTSDVIKAIERAVDDGADVINLSLGASGDADDPLSRAADNASQAGVVVVAAAGNSGTGFARIGQPGAARRAITVGATDDLDAAATFTSTGPARNTFDVKPEIAAPGVSICAADTDPGLTASGSLGPDCIDANHMVISGTSMATPHVAGAAALLVNLYPSYTPEEIKSLLVNNAVDVGLPVLTAGAGRLDIPAAAAAATIVSPATLSFGRDDLALPVWTAQRAFTVRNEDAVTRNYVLAPTAMEPGITAQVVSSTFALAPGESRQVTLELTVDNTMLPAAHAAPHAYDGAVLVESDGQTQRLPFAFLTVIELRLRFDRLPDVVIVHDRNGFGRAGFPDDAKIDGLYVPPGTYDVMWGNDFVPGAASSSSLFVHEGIAAPIDTTVSIKTPREQHLVTFRPTDVRGDPLLSDTGRRFARLWHEGGRAGFIIIGSVGHTAKFMRLVTGDIPASYRMDFSTAEYLVGAAEEYLSAASILDGIFDDVTVGNAGPLVEASLRYYPRAGQTPADVRMIAAQWMFLDGGGGVGLASFGLAPEGFHRQLYTAPAADVGDPNTMRFEVYPQPWDPFGYRNPSESYSVQAETLALRGGLVPGTITGHNDFEQRQTAAVYQDGDEIPVGLGPYYWWLRADNDDQAVALDLPFGSDPGGLLAFASQSSGRAVDVLTHSVAWEVRAGSTVVASGSLPQLYSERYFTQTAPVIPAPPGVYTLAATGPVHTLGGVEGSTSYEATFDTQPPVGPQPYDPNPPWMSSLEILVGGVPSDHTYTDTAYTVDVVIRDDTDDDGGTGVASVDLTVATSGGDVVIPGVPTGGNRWVMTVTDSCELGPVSLTITASDTAGNLMRQVLSPALICLSENCGNGTLDAGESCDDGNRQPFDCCSEQCDHEPQGMPCADDGEQCTADRCDGSGTCTHSAEARDHFSCDDGDPCTTQSTCLDGACIGGFLLGTDDEDINARITPGAGNDRMVVRATLDPSRIGNFPTESGMELILLDATSTPLYSAVLPAPHWTDRDGTHRRFAFRDRDHLVAAANGVSLVKIKRKKSGSLTLKVKIDGGDLAMLLGEPSVKLRVLFGNGSAADCVADPDLPCTSTAAAVRCRN